MCSTKATLLVVAAVLVACTYNVAAGLFKKSEGEKEVHDLDEYVSDLDRLGSKDDVTDPESPVQQALNGVCDAIVQAPPTDDHNFADVVKKTLVIWNRCLGAWKSKTAFAEWNYSTDLSKENEKKLSDLSLKATKWFQSLTRGARQYQKDPRYVTLDKDLQRQIRLMAADSAPIKTEDSKRLFNISARMQQMYSTAKMEDMNLEPDLTDIMAEQRDPDVLLAAWYGWRNATGPRMIDDYEEYVRLMNIGATDNGYPDFAAAWLDSQFDETKGMEALSDILWLELEPLYKEFHAYVRYRLEQQYGGASKLDFDTTDSIFEAGGIPAHLTGNMWAQNWNNIYDIVKPFSVAETDYNQALVDQKYDVERLFTTAEGFYTSIGLEPMTKDFKEHSMKVRPQDGREVVCHASAYDFYTTDDFRIKMCTEVNMDYFETIHHEMGHIEYFMAYKGQPAVYREGANSAFHEAIGDTISLSVLTRQHLQTIKLASGQHGEMSDLTGKLGATLTTADKRAINYLFEKALTKVAFLPFGLLIDKWRWDVFQGQVTKENYNKHWWKLRLDYQGIISPLPRSATDFDPGAKYHIPSNSPYICYFISFIIQFQFFESMCDASGHDGPLYNCDFYDSKEAGAKLLSMLKLGKSKPWPDAMDILTGTRDISTKSILNYFKPLYTWLKAENAKNGVNIGWDGAKINWKH